jgi:hypothetical protein
MGTESSLPGVKRLEPEAGYSCPLIAEFRSTCKYTCTPPSVAMAMVLNKAQGNFALYSYMFRHSSVPSSGIKVCNKALDWTC